MTSRPAKIQLLCISLLLAASVLLLGLLKPQDANALSGSQWQPGYIIDDSLFFSPNLMGANDIQTFLSAKVPVCDTNGSQMHSSGMTRGQYGTSQGNPPPYTCLKDYTQNVTPTSPDAYCANGISGGVKSAAMIIAEVAWACGINPQVLIVLLQKEQSLVTDDWPWPRQYQFATGFCVYDTGPPPPSCADTDGFFRQVYYAARQFQKYVKNPQNYNYRAGQTSNILWNVATTGCGGANVYIQNGATAALYNYTPYQPNQAALNNLYGSGDGCSAYGNRNFWRMFNDWFGPTMGSLVKTPFDNTVYLLNGSTAHPIYDANILNDYAALGPVRITSASEINTHTAGPILGRMVGDAGGSTLYLVNASIKLPFTTCSSVTDYGYSCSQVTQLSTLLLNKLVNGPPVTPLLKAVNNPTIYYVTGGTKRPIPSWSEVQAFRIATMNTLTDPFVNQIPFNSFYAYGPGSLVKTSNSPNVYVVKDHATILPLTDFFFSRETGLGTSVRTIASSYSIASNNFGTKFQCSGTNYVGTNGVTYLIPTAMMTAYGFQQSEFVDGGSSCLGLPISSQYLDRFIRLNNGNIFYVTGGQKRWVTSYSVYQAYGGNSNNTIQASDSFANYLPDGPNLDS